MSPLAASQAHRQLGRPRASVKTHTKPEIRTGSTSFQERLDVKRQQLAATQALAAEGGLGVDGAPALEVRPPEDPDLAALASGFVSPSGEEDGQGGARVMGGAVGTRVLGRFEFPQVLLSGGVGADLDFVVLPTRREIEVDDGEAWLGVTVLEAHRQPCTLGVRIARSQGLVSLFSKVRRWLEQRRLYSCRVAAVAPQRFAGSAQLLVYPESLDAQALVAVVVDLSRVGGHYYAENVYRHITTEEFIDLVQYELDWDPDDIAVYVGSGFLPRLPPEELCVAHGDVVTVLRREVHTPTLWHHVANHVHLWWLLLRPILRMRKARKMPLPHGRWSAIYARWAFARRSFAWIRMTVGLIPCWPPWLCRLPGFELVVSELPSPGVGLPALLLGSRRVEADWSAPPLRTAAPWGALDALLYGSRLFSVGAPTEAVSRRSRPLHRPRQAIPSDEETSEVVSQPQVLLARALILTLGGVGQVFEVELELPATVAEFADRVGREVPQSFQSRFPTLVEVRPQPSHCWATLLALPCWTSRAALVVFDLSRIDGRLFVARFPDLASYDHICSLACLPADGSFSVFAYGSTIPLAREAVLPLLEHGCIVFVPVEAGPFQLPHLSVMLTSAFGWDLDDPIPLGPGGPRGNFVCTVLDTGPRLFILRPGRGRHYLEDLAEEFGIPLHWMTARATRPAIGDVCHGGYRCKGVALVSRQFPNVPVPPGLSRPGDFAVALDCRPILQGWRQHVVRDYVCSRDELVDLFSYSMPAGFRVLIQGLLFGVTALSLSGAMF
eukprot:s3353_g8.t2